MTQCPTVPAQLTQPLKAPSVELTKQRGLLDLLADYEALRRRANADRAAVSSIIATGNADDDQETE